MSDTKLTFTEAVVKEAWGHRLEPQKPPLCDFIDAETNDIVKVKKKVLQHHQADQFYESFTEGGTPMLADVQPFYVLVFRLERIMETRSWDFIQAKEAEWDAQHPEPDSNLWRVERGRTLEEDTQSQRASSR
jgi:hypothetical protein